MSLSRYSFREFLNTWYAQHDRDVPLSWNQMAMWLECMLARGETRLVLLAFRSAGKSTITGFLISWLLLCDRRLRIVVVSAEQSLASRMAGHIRMILETHSATQDLVPKRGNAVRSWSSDCFWVSGAGKSREPSVMARGIESNITGSRADIVICDDVEVPNTVSTPLQRESLRRRLHELNFVRVAGGVTLHLGTPHHSESIYSGERGVDGMAPFLSGWRTLRLPALDSSGRLTSPQSHTEESLRALRDSVGEGRFGAQMLLRPQTEGEYPFHSSLLRNKVYVGELSYREAGGESILELGGRRLVKASCHWDPAVIHLRGEEKRRDKNVIALLFQEVSRTARDFSLEEDSLGENSGEIDDVSLSHGKPGVGAGGAIYLHRLFYVSPPPAGEMQSPLDWLCGEVAEFVESFYIPVISVEVNGIGAYLPGPLRGALAARGIGAVVTERHTRDNKSRRIEHGLGTLFSSGLLMVHESVMSTPFVTELNSWRPDVPGLHDDGMDAVATAYSYGLVKGGGLESVRGMRWRLHGGGVSRLPDVDPYSDLP
ncbi:MAG: phage terminase large subunit [Alphaproteobacteria bacterium]